MNNQTIIIISILSKFEWDNFRVYHFLYVVYCIHFSEAKFRKWMRRRIKMSQFDAPNYLVHERTTNLTKEHINKRENNCKKDTQAHSCDGFIAIKRANLSIHWGIIGNWEVLVVFSVQCSVHSSELQTRFYIIVERSSTVCCICLTMLTSIRNFCAPSFLFTC